MEHLRLFTEQSKDAATRKMAAKMALRGYQVSGHEFHDTSIPYCDVPVPIQRDVRSGGYEKSIRVTMYRPCRKCPKCLQFRQLVWRDRAITEIARAPRTWFVTLTFSPTHLAGIIFESANALGNESQRLDSAAYSHVQRYLKRLRKAARAKIRYMAVFERGEESGRAHYHLLINEVDRPVSKRTLQSQWRSHVHCRLVASAAGSAAYITTYATKSFDIRPRASQRYGWVAKP